MNVAQRTDQLVGQRYLVVKFFATPLFALFRARRVGITCLALLAFSIEASGQVYEKVFSFTDARAAAAINTGFFPLPALVRGDDGNFYGTTTEGGSLAGDYGTVFRMTPDGVATT